MSARLLGLQFKSDIIKSNHMKIIVKKILPDYN